jgi:hypothetical protein
MNAHEDAFVSAFIVKEKQGRYRELLANPKRRAKALDDLNHGRDLDPSYAQPIGPDQRRAPAVARLLRQRGAPDQCYVLADDEDLDGQELALEEAVERAAAGAFMAVVCCVPGRLAFYRQEAPGEWYVLDRRG